MPLVKEISLGSLRLKSNLFLAPMAGITNRAFRVLAAEGGAGLVVTEMVSADSVRFANRKSFRMLELSPAEHPAAVQIFGSIPESMALAAGRASATERAPPLCETPACSPKSSAQW